MKIYTLHRAISRQRRYSKVSCTDLSTRYHILIFIPERYGDRLEHSISVYSTGPKVTGQEDKLTSQSMHNDCMLTVDLSTSNYIIYMAI